MTALPPPPRVTVEDDVASSPLISGSRWKIPSYCANGSYAVLEVAGVKDGHVWFETTLTVHIPGQPTEHHPARSTIWTGCPLPIWLTSLIGDKAPYRVSLREFLNHIGNGDAEPMAPQPTATLRRTHPEEPVAIKELALLR